MLETKYNMRDTAEQLLIAIKNSSAEVAKDTKTWFFNNFPTKDMPDEAQANLVEFLVFIAVQTRVMMKIARIGVALKLAMTLSLGYFDVLTDLLVAKSYYDAGDSATAYAMAGLQSRRFCFRRQLLSQCMRRNRGRSSCGARLQLF